MSTNWVFGLSAVGGLLVALVLISRKRWTPRQWRSSNRVALGIAFVIGCPAIAYLLFHTWKKSPGSWIAMGAWAVAVAVLGYEVFFRRQSAAEEAANFGEDPGRCGQCGYDLTGNVSGICPECGWRIPQLPHRWERVGWALWWQQWRIEYLHNWRRTLVTLAASSVVFAAMAVLSIVVYGRSMLAFAILPGAMCVHMVVNAIRVIAYGRSQRIPNEDAPDRSDTRV